MQKSFICLLQTYINEEKFSSFQNVMMLRIESKINTLNCKINSTNGGTFSKSAEKNIFIFFLFQGASVMSK